MLGRSRFPWGESPLGWATHCCPAWTQESTQTWAPQWHRRWCAPAACSPCPAPGGHKGHSPAGRRAHRRTASRLHGLSSLSASLVPAQRSSAVLFSWLVTGSSQTSWPAVDRFCPQPHPQSSEAQLSNGPKNPVLKQRIYCYVVHHKHPTCH